MISTLSSFLLVVSLFLGSVHGGSLLNGLPALQQDPNKQDASKQQEKDKKRDQQNKDQKSQGANPQQQPPQNPPPKQGDNKPAPLFGGTLNLKSSRQTKDSATLGFNGVDPNGKVQQSFLTAAASGADNAKAAQIAAYKVSDTDLAQFIQDGGLSQAAPSQKSAN